MGWWKKRIYFLSCITWLVSFNVFLHFLFQTSSKDATVKTSKKQKCTSSTYKQEHITQESLSFTSFWLVILKYVWKVKVQIKLSLSTFILRKYPSSFVLPKPAFPFQTLESCTVGKYTFLGCRKTLLNSKR